MGHNSSITTTPKFAARRGRTRYIVITTMLLSAHFAVVASVLARVVYSAKNPSIADFGVVCGTHTVRSISMTARTVINFVEDNGFTFAINGDMHSAVCTGNKLTEEVLDDGSRLFSIPKEGRQECLSKELDGTYANIDLFFKICELQYPAVYVHTHIPPGGGA